MAKRRYANIFDDTTFTRMSDRNNYEAQKAFKILKKQHVIFLDEEYEPMTEHLAEWENFVNTVVKDKRYEDAPNNFRDSGFWEDFVDYIGYILIPKPTKEIFTALNVLDIVELGEQAIPLEISDKSMVLKTVDNRYLDDCSYQWIDIAKYGKDLKEVLKNVK